MVSLDFVLGPRRARVVVSSLGSFGRMPPTELSGLPISPIGVGTIHGAAAGSIIPGYIPPPTMGDGTICIAPTPGDINPTSLTIGTVDIKFGRTCMPP
mmetsp:Transcript_33856/g.102134  ORF Transcript_33856/g.102134 Transcript_33856/m.102134 type:complete len:98 (+) Transcript_33856:1456-1749(+)